VIRRYLNADGRLRLDDRPGDNIDGVVWFDLLNPTAEEEAALGARLALHLPSREDMEEIEVSSRLYHEDGAAFMTASLPARSDSGPPQMAPVAFVLTVDRLVTIRYHEPRAFQTFPTRAEKVAMGCHDGETVLVTLLEAVIDRLADILEIAGRDIDGISHDVFQKRGDADGGRDFQAILESLGHKGDLISNIRDSLVTMERLIAFLNQEATQRKSGKEVRTRVKTLARDAHSLTDHAGFLSQKITFLLDASLGMINIQQNAIIKIFSVAAVAFLPPTLIASVYGMNFHSMPELDWPWGYPLALALMVLSAVVPLWFFKRRGWL
jgi:magnesium transporter